jgi:hypothetical protein
LFTRIEVGTRLGHDVFVVDSVINCPRCQTPNVPGEGRVIFCVSCGELINVHGSRPASQEAVDAQAPYARHDSVLLAVKDGQEHDLPDKWQQMSTQVPPAERSPSVVDIADLVSDLDLDPPEESPTLQLSTAELSEFPSKPMAHDDQHATLLLSTPTAQQAALGLITKVENNLSNHHLSGHSIPDTPTARARPRPASVTTRVEVSPPLEDPNEPAQTIPAPDQAHDDLKIVSAAPSPLGTLALNENVPTKENTNAPEDPKDYLFGGPPPRPLSSPPGPQAQQASLISQASTEVSQKMAPAKTPKRPVTQAPDVGEDPFDNLDFRQDASAPETDGASEPPYDDLAALSAEIMAAEERARTSPDLSAQPESSPPMTSKAPKPPESPTLPASPASPAIASPARPRTVQDGASHGWKVDFVSTSAPSPASPPPMLSETAPPTLASPPAVRASPVTKPLKPVAERSSSTAQQQAREQSLDETHLEAIARPALIVPILDSKMEEVVHQIAVAMTATVKKTRVNSKKSLLITGLLLTQTKLLREKLRAKNIACTIVDPASINIGYSLSSFVPHVRFYSLVKVAILAIGLAVVVLGARFTQEVWHDYKMESALRDSISEIKTRAMKERVLMNQVIKPEEKPDQVDLVDRNEVQFGGRNSKWWGRQLKALRIQERSAPSDQRTEIRVRLLDTERKARAFGLALK